MSGHDETTSFTRILYECSECNAHHLPPRTHAALFTAEEFDTKQVYKVKLQVKTWSFKRAAVELYSNNSLFASCPLDGTRSSDTIERCTGSSRYFALKIVSSAGKKAFLGVSFKERTEAFDFLAALQEWDDKKDAALSASSDCPVESIDETLVQLPMRDLSLKQGIKLKIKKSGEDMDVVKATAEESASNGSQESAVRSEGGLAPPPPSGVSRRQRGQRQ